MSTDIGIKDQQQNSIEDLFIKKSRYVLPPFQREYAWKKDDWIDYLSDVLKAKEVKGHFFGFMTFKTERDNEISIIEGQQRLTTATILIAVVRDILYEKNDDYWKELHSEYITVKDVLMPNRLPLPKLVLSDFNKNFFEKYIQKEANPQDKIKNYKVEKQVNNSNKLIFGCYEYYFQELNNKIKDLSNDNTKNFLIDIIYSSLRYFVVITTYVTNEDSAFNIFQTLNDRGLDLTMSDLLKIYLLKTAGDPGWKDAKDKWDEIKEILSTTNPNTFLRHYWLSEEGIIKENELLHEIMKKYKTKELVFNFLDKLREEAERYDALLNPTESYWGNKIIVELLDDLHILSTHMPMPFLMSACTLQTNDFIELINTTINTIFRYITIGEMENKQLERVFSDIARDIRNAELTSVGEINKRLRKICPDDETFLKIFSNKEIGKAKVAKYILVKIEDHLSGPSEKVRKRITLEHILPRNPDEKWSSYLKKNGMIKNELIDRIGNLTLLLDKPNKQAQNEFFIKKRDKIYQNMTALKINESLRDIKSWTIENINERQKMFAGIAIKIWKI